MSIVYSLLLVQCQTLRLMLPLVLPRNVSSLPRILSCSLSIFGPFLSPIIPARCQLLPPHLAQGARGRRSRLTVLCLQSLQLKNRLVASITLSLCFSCRQRSADLKSV